MKMAPHCMITWQLFTDVVESVVLLAVSLYHIGMYSHCNYIAKYWHSFSINDFKILELLERYKVKKKICLSVFSLILFVLQKRYKEKVVLMYKNNYFLLKYVCQG